VKTVFDSMKPT